MGKQEEAKNPVGPSEKVVEFLEVKDYSMTLEDPNDKFEQELIKR